MGVETAVRFYLIKFGKCVAVDIQNDDDFKQNCNQNHSSKGTVVDTVWIKKKDEDPLLEQHGRRTANGYTFQLAHYPLPFLFLTNGASTSSQSSGLEGRRLPSNPSIKIRVGWGIDGWY